MKKLKFVFVLSAVLAAVVFVLPKKGYTQGVNDFVITDFSGRYELFNDTHGGHMHVVETIKPDFFGDNHGILRAIPDTYRGKSLKLTVISVRRDGNSEPYRTYTQNHNTVLKIGDPNRTITGLHTYEIAYDMKNVVSFLQDHDEWYWDINGDQWLQPFEHVKGEVIFPSGWNSENLPKADCFTGAYGTSGEACVITPTATGYRFETTAPLNGHETLTVATAAPKGLFTAYTFHDWLKDNWWQLVGIAAGSLAVIYSFTQWFKYGRDHKGRGVIVPEYEPPKGLSPAEVGLLMDYNLDGRDLTATIIDLAVRGYIRIHDEQKTKFLFVNSREFSLELVLTDTSRLKPHETSLLQALFDPFTPGTIQAMTSVDRHKMYQTVTDIRSSLKDKLTKEYGLFEKKPQTWRLVGVAAVCFVALMVFRTGWGWIAGMLSAIAITVVFALFMRRRSHAGVEAYEKVKGLELYMKTAEAQRLKMLQSVDRPYAEPSKTVELFEKLLPFAVALGVERSWANQFENIYAQPPGWYQGNFSTFQMAAFTSSLTSGVSALNTSFSAPTSSGGSGMGGGGFSGGGGGGGGGGGW